MQGLLRGEKPGCPGSKAGSCSGWERLPRWPSRERQSPRQELEGDPPNTDPASQRPGTGSSHRKASSKLEGDPLTQGLPQTTFTAGPLGTTLRPFAGGRWHQPPTSFFACHQPHSRLGGPDGANVQGLNSLSRELGAEADAGGRQRAPRSHTDTPPPRAGGCTHPQAPTPQLCLSWASDRGRVSAFQKAPSPFFRERVTTAVPSDHVPHPRAGVLRRRDPSQTHWRGPRSRRGRLGRGCGAPCHHHHRRPGGGGLGHRERATPTAGPGTPSTQNWQRSPLPPFVTIVTAATELTQDSTPSPRLPGCEVPVSPGQGWLRAVCGGRKPGKGIRESTVTGQRRAMSRGHPQPQTQQPCPTTVCRNRDQGPGQRPRGQGPLSPRSGPRAWTAVSR